MTHSPSLWLVGGTLQCLGRIVCIFPSALSAKKKPPLTTKNKRRGFHRAAELVFRPSILTPIGGRAPAVILMSIEYRDRLSPLNKRQKKKVYSISESEDPISG